MKDSFDLILKESQDKINRQFLKRIKRLESLVNTTEGSEDDTNTNSGDNDGSGSEEP